ncbi:electron transport protein SCO1/SenC [Thermocrinis albus DSM 14484]|uniref:Electron transport protein SCO1/SenC n=1 Tax=Thermocrinis albus (strain DSM 14484 / JCM 11386 / HI 11/12) TaxID=638303 RepID=D3SN04_THEAH|nr:SCO family protein [Thermocrinis albus]ADC90134.1 electron transport protein SCO1/SenC [Thermocrinis albus DSM 14484]
MKVILLLTLLLAYAMAYRISSYGEQDVSVVKVEEDLYLGKPVPNFRVHTLKGDVDLYSFIKGHPTALVFVYFTCDTACPLTVSNLYKISTELSSNYRYVVLSFDERDNLNTLRNLVRKTFGAENPPPNWLVGTLSKEDINQITTSTGLKFYYIERDKIFLHTSAVIFLSPEGRIMRYLYGAFFRPKDVSLAFVDAQRENPSVSNLIDLAVLACYRYDHSRSKYVLDPLVIFALLGIGGVVTTLGLAKFYRVKQEVKE